METNRIIDLIEDFCNASGYEFRDDYSGRNMYGRRCVGFVTENYWVLDLIALCDHLRDNDVDSCIDAIGNVSTDNMGLDMIIYFPNLRRK